MTEGDLVLLRQQLLVTFDEDVVQDTIVALLALPVEPEVPLAWCRAVARKRRLQRRRNEGRRRCLPLSPAMSTRPIQERLLIAKEALLHAHPDLLRDAFGAPGRLARQRRSEQRLRLKRLAEGRL